MKRMLQVVVCAMVIGLTAVGCSGGTKAPPPGSAGDPAPLIKSLIEKVNNKKLKSEERGGAIIGLSRFGSQAQEALPMLEKIAAGDKDKSLQKKAEIAVKRIKGEE
jgi:hypothetical protein